VQNPFSLADKHPVDQQPKHVPTLADAQKVIDAANTQEDRVFLMALLHTAARRGEICRLRWDDVDLEGRKVHLGTRKRKGGAMQYDWIAMTRELAEAFKVLKENARGEYVFPRTEEGEPYKWRQHLTKRLCSRAGVRYFGFHGFRHLTASLLAANGVPMPEIQFVLRHQAMTTTNGYIRRLGFSNNPLEGIFGGENPAELETAVSG
jgi:integrase